ncbi:MAG: LamG domain-containing protein [Methylococcaceae bacterium]
MPPATIISWWPAENNANDIKKLNNGILKNGATFTQGMVGKAFSLNDNTSAFVSIPNSTSLNVGTGDFSMEAWVKSNARKDIATIMDKRDPKNGFVGYHWYLSYRGFAGLQIVIPNGASLTIDSTVFIPDGKFHHLAVTVKRDSKTGLKFYVDGALVNTYDPTTVQGNLDNTTSFLIGGHHSDSWRTFNGAIDEFSFYKRELSDAEIAAIFNAGSVGKCQSSIYNITNESTLNLDFATHYDAKNAQTVELKNSTANPITVSNVIISDASNYWVNLFADKKKTCRAKHYSPNSKNFTIPANGSCSIAIGFSPFDDLTAAKSIPATLTLKTLINGIATDKVINLTGIGRAQVANYYNNDSLLWGKDTWGVVELKGGNAPINTSLVGASSGYSSAKYWYGGVINSALQQTTASVGNLVVFAQNSIDNAGHVGVIIQTTPVLTMLSMNDIKDQNGIKMRKWSVRPVDFYPSNTVTWSPLITGFNTTDVNKHYGFIKWKNAWY